MSITIALSPEKEQRLREIYGSDEDITRVYERILDTLLDIQPTKFTLECKAGMHRGWITYMAEDFDEQLPDSFWLGEE